MRRRDESGFCLAAGTDAGRYVHTFFVDWNRNEAAACGHEDAALQAIARLFDPDRIAGIEKHAGGNIERLLRTGDDHDLADVALHATSGAEIVGDSFAKAICAERVDVMNGAGARIAAMTSDQARPCLKGELIEGRLVDAKGSPTEYSGVAM